TAFGGDPAVIGQPITIDGRPRAIVGVLPPGFSFRPVIRIGALPAVDIFLPNRWANDPNTSAFLTLLGRMKPGVTQEQAQAELTSLLSDSSLIPAGARSQAGVFSA